MEHLDLNVGDRVRVKPDNNFFKRLQGVLGVVFHIYERHNNTGARFIAVRLDDLDQVVPMFDHEIEKVEENNGQPVAL